MNIIWNKAVTAIHQSKVFSGKEVFEADMVFICNGANFETLYPETFAAADITKCKLQMMRFRGDTNNFDLGTSICGGLSLIHYHSFKEATTLPTLQKGMQPKWINIFQRVFM